MKKWFYIIKAFWVAHTAVKIILDEEDNRRASPYDTKVAKAAMLEHFEIKDRFYYHIYIILVDRIFLIKKIMIGLDYWSTAIQSLAKQFTLDIVPNLLMELTKETHFVDTYSKKLAEC